MARPRKTATAAVAQPQTAQPARQRRPAIRPVPEPGTPGADLLVGTEEIARYVGLSRRMVAHYVQAKKLPIIKLGRRVLARKSDLDAALRARQPEAE